MKVYLHLEEEKEDGGDASAAVLPEMTIKLTLPKSWQASGFERLRGTFVTSYNKKHGEGKIDAATWHFESSDGKEYADDAPIKEHVKSGADLFLRRGKGKTMEELGIAPQEPAGEAAPKKVAPPKAPASTGACKPVKKTAKKNDGRLVCKRFGCSARYLEGENHESACRYHAKPPIFHETRKWWACCPKKIAWDWETFTAIPGCCVGEHSNVAQGKKFLGGVDVRAEKAQEYEYAPKPIGSSKAANAKKEKSGLEKLLDLRKALVAVGVDAAIFDRARDAVKANHEAKGAKCWDAVCQDLSKVFEASLASASIVE